MRDLDNNTNNNINNNNKNINNCIEISKKQ